MDTLWISHSTSNLEQQQQAEKATTSKDLEWARIQSPPPIEGLDDYQEIETLLAESIQPTTKINPIFCQEFPIQSLLSDSQIKEQITQLCELFGDDHIDQSERRHSERKEKYSLQWNLHDDPFLLHHHMAKISPIPYTDWPHKQGFQIYPYTPNEKGIPARSESKA